MKIVQITTDSRVHFKKAELANPYFGTAPAALLAGFEGVSEVEIHVISCSPVEMNAPEKIAENIWFHQCVVSKIGWGRTLFQGCVRATRTLIRDIQPDIVHGQGTERDCAISAVYSGFPNVLTIHGNMQRIHRMKLLGANSYYWMASNLETHALGRTEGVLCNSGHTRSLVEGRTRKTWLVPNPLRAAFLQPAAPASRGNPLPVLLVVGVVTRLKRPLEILRAMKSLFEAGHRFKLRFVGALSTDRSYTTAFTDLLAEASRSGYAEHLGTLNEEQLVQTMDEADALIHFPQEEAFGLVVAEALARNLKVFAARIGGIPDILEGTDGSEMFDDLKSLERGIARWITEGIPRPSGNPALMRERYAPEVIARWHLEIYQEVLSQKSR
jgi:glycosyltransferase involved in cell wall biosynthesis